MSRLWTDALLCLVVLASACQASPEDQSPLESEAPGFDQTDEAQPLTLTVERDVKGMTLEGVVTLVQLLHRDGGETRLRMARRDRVVRALPSTVTAANVFLLGCTPLCRDVDWELLEHFGDVQPSCASRDLIQGPTASMTVSYKGRGFGLKPPGEACHIDWDD